MITLLFTLACASQPDPSGDGGAGDSGPGDGGLDGGGVDGSDQVAISLSATADLCAWDHGEEAEIEPEEDPEGYIGDLWTQPYKPCLDGYAGMRSWIMDQPAGRIEDVAASATFFTVSQVSQDWQKAQWLDPEEGLDDCGLARVLPDGLYQDGDLVWLDPGAVDLTTPKGPIPLLRREGGSVLNWEANLAGLGIATEAGGSFGLSVAGSAGGGDWAGFDAIELPDLISLPPRVELLAPADLGPGDLLKVSDTEFRWTGSSKAPLKLQLDGSVDEVWYLLRCSVVDDGAFTVPGDLLAELPPGIRLNLQLVRWTDTWLGTEAGRSFHGYGLTSHDIIGIELP